MQCALFLHRFAFQYNPSLQPRALVVFGCISKRVSHGQIKQIIRILSKVYESLFSLVSYKVAIFSFIFPSDIELRIILG